MNKRTIVLLASIILVSLGSFLAVSVMRAVPSQRICQWHLSDAGYNLTNVEGRNLGSVLGAFNQASKQTEWKAEVDDIVWDRIGSPQAAVHLIEHQQVRNGNCTEFEGHRLVDP